MMIVGNDFFKRSLPPLTACATIRLAATLYAACVGVPSRNRIRIGTCTDYQSEFQQLSDDRVVLSTGTLKRLLEAGWIERVESPVLDESTRETKAYRLTTLGERMLEAETARLRRLVQLAHERVPQGAQ